MEPYTNSVNDLEVKVTDFRNVTLETARHWYKDLPSTFQVCDSWWIDLIIQNWITKNWKFLRLKYHYLWLFFLNSEHKICKVELKRGCLKETVFLCLQVLGNIHEFRAQFRFLADRKMFWSKFP